MSNPENPSEKFEDYLDKHGVKFTGVDVNLVILCKFANMWMSELQSQNSTLLSLVRRCDNTLRSTPCPKCVDEINGGEGHGGAGCYLKETLSLIEKAEVLG